MEERTFSNFLDVYTETITNKTWFITFLGSFIFFLIIQQIGEKIHKQLLNPQQQTVVSSILFGSYLMSFVHSIIATIRVYFYAYNQLDGVDIPNYIIICKMLGVISPAYFVSVAIYDGFIVTNLKHRAPLLVHHVICIFCSIPEFLTPSVVLYISVIGLSVELSNIFMNVRIFSKIAGNKCMFFIGGLATLIIYPITRLVTGVFLVYETIRLMDEIVETATIGVFYVFIFGQIFVILMSFFYFLTMIKSPSKMLYLTSKKNKKSN